LQSFSLSRTRQSQLARSLTDRWQGNSYAFAYDMWGGERWELPPRGVRQGKSCQADLYSVVDRGETRISWAAAQKTGKSCGVVEIAIHWVLTKPHGFVILTAPTYSQIVNILWRELTTKYHSARFPIGGELFKTPDKGLQFPWGAGIIGRAPRDEDSMQGLSGADQLYIADEASGIRTPIMEAILGNTVGGGTVIITGNPLRSSGVLYESQTLKAGVWATLQTCGLDSPNFYGKNIPGLTSPATIDFFREQWGEGTPAWDARIMGRFPSTSIDTVIPLALADLARNRLTETKPEGFLSVGIDPAGFGDDSSVIYFRRGPCPVAVLSFQGLDGPDLAGKFLEALVPLRGHAEPIRVNVDVTGEGASCFDALVRAAAANGLELNGVNFGASPTAQPPVGPGYANLATQMWFELRAALEQGAALPDESVCSRVDSAKLEGELVARKYGFDMQGRLILERKKDMKARIGRSPDRADACVLAHYQPPPAGHVQVRGQRKLAGRMGGF
jgi:phage terminase large subunit